MKRFYLSPLLAFYVLPTSSDQWVDSHVSHITQGAPSTHLEKLKTQWKKENPQGITLESVTQSFWNSLDQSPPQYTPL